MGLDPRKPVFIGLGTTKAQTRLRSLISAFVIPLLKSIISKLATRELSIFYLAYVAEETSLRLVLSETSTSLVESRPIFELVPSIRYKLACAYNKDSNQSAHLCSMVIGVAPITKFTHVHNKNSNIQGKSPNVVKSDFPYHKELLLKERIRSHLERILSLR